MSGLTQQPFFAARRKRGFAPQSLTGNATRKNQAFKSVIASRHPIDGFVDRVPGEAIQFLEEKRWIASSQELLAMTNLNV